jgi:hypothetical protein
MKDSVGEMRSSGVRGVFAYCSDSADSGGPAAA